MEIVLVVFLGVWISAAGVLAHKWLKNEFKQYLKNTQNKELENNE